MIIFTEWKDPFILFKFAAEDFGKVPLYAELADPSWSPLDFDEILNYLREARICAVASLPGGPRQVACRLCGEFIERGCASVQQTDGRWFWFGSLAHYVEFHHVRLPDRMVEHIRANRHQPGGAAG